MIERMLLHDMIVKEIKKIIIDNKLVVGDKLPPQAELVSKFKVSRTSLREAFRTLQALNIIDVKNGKGTYVISNSFMLHDDDVEDKQKKDRLIHVVEVRRAIEALAVELAVENATEEDLRIMKENLDVMEEMANKGKPHPEYDKAFHLAIYRASRNPVLLETVNYLNKQFEVLWENPLGAGDALTEGTAYHIELYNGIYDKDTKMAMEAFDKLIDQVEVIINNI